jgi:hypothetical protein
MYRAASLESGLSPISGLYLAEHAEAARLKPFLVTLMSPAHHQRHHRPRRDREQLSASGIVRMLNTVVSVLDVTVRVYPMVPGVDRQSSISRCHHSAARGPTASRFQVLAAAELVQGGAGNAPFVRGSFPLTRVSVAAAVASR